LFYALGLQFTFGLCIWIGIDLMRARGSLSRRMPFLVLTGSCALWALGELLVQVSGGDGAILFSRRVLWLGAAVLPTAWMLTAAGSARARWAVERPGRAAIGLVPMLAIYSSLWWDPQGHFTAWTSPRPIHGPLFLVFWLVGWAQIAIGTSYFIEAAVRRHKASPLRLLAIVVGSSLPMLGNALHLLPWSAGVDWTPVFLGVGGLLIRLSVLDSGLAAVLPMSRGQVLEQVPTGVLIADLEGRVIDANGAARALLDQPDLEGRSAEALLADRLANPKRVVEVETAPLLGRLGEAGHVVLLTDRTEAARLEQQLLQSQKLESLGLLAGGVAHDFNNLLTGILGNAHLARSELAPGTPRDCVGDVIQAAELAARLTGQMLAYSGRGHVDVKPLDLSREVRSIAALLQASVPKNVQLVLELRHDLPAIEADPAQMQQIVLNLVLNAAEAIGERAGTIRVASGASHVDEAEVSRLAPGSDVHAGVHAWVEVQDDGCGMDTDTVARMFDPFFSTKFAGRGLGLAAVLGIARAHRGGMRVRSEPGRGTTIRTYLPAATRALEAEPVPEPATSGRGTGLVLVVDDEPVVRETARRALERAGFEALVVEGGRKAVEAFRARGSEIRLVLLDLTMPDASGLETYRALRELDDKVPILLSSGFAEDATLSTTAQDPRSAFMAKPYAPDELVARVSALIDRARQL